MRPHEELEQRLSASPASRALLFSTGYLANPGIVPALLGRAMPYFPTSLTMPR
ncbi:hypothetical protein [Propionivibrio sp.]|uniref:hypothetical protein n=1 Tax=Propionivibrio sp. TaxID=2212460 RepID=UPI0025F3363B|nr:hypothetical protein [Propionivibrio sp.]